MKIKKTVFIVQEIKPIQTLSIAYQFTEIILAKSRRGYDDGDILDNIFSCRVWIDKMDLIKDIEPGDKVKVSLNLQGRKLWDENGKSYFSHFLNVEELTKL